MPFYEYECRECGFRFEKLLSFAKRDEIERELACPSCGAKHPERMISAFATGSSTPAAGPSCGTGG